MDDTCTQESPDYKEVTYEEQWNFKFIKCADLGKTIWPYTKVWKRTYWITGGAIVGLPPSRVSSVISPESYTMRILKGNR